MSTQPVDTSPVYTGGGTAMDALTAMFAQFGLQDLAIQVGELAARTDLTDAQKYVAVYDLPAYKERFPAMADLRKQGAAISEATYIAQEQAYQQVLSDKGLPSGFYDSRQDFAKWMLGGVSASELANRVDKAQAIVNSSDPTLLNAARDYYGLDKNHLLAYVIDPERAQPLIDKQVAAIQTGAAAQRHGFDVNVLQAEALASNPDTAGMSTSQLDSAFANAADLRRTDSRLSSIEGQQYDPNTAIDEALNHNYAQTLASQQRAQREVARFSGAAGGVTQKSLTTNGS